MAEQEAKNHYKSLVDSKGIISEEKFVKCFVELITSDNEKKRKIEDLNTLEEEPQKKFDKVTVSVFSPPRNLQKQVKLGKSKIHI